MKITKTKYLSELKPTVEDYEREINRRQKSASVKRLYKNFFFTLVFVASVAVLIAMLWLPVMMVNGTSMEPKLDDGDIIIAIKNVSAIRHGDLVAFYYNDKVLLKRAIGLPGDTINIDEDGNVYVNGSYLDEPYIKTKSKGICDVQMPIKIQENSLFVLGDNRSVSVDSRSQDVGNIYFERVVGKIVLRIFPLNKFGKVNGN